MKRRRSIVAGEIQGRRYAIYMQKRGRSGDRNGQAILNESCQIGGRFCATRRTSSDVNTLLRLIVETTRRADERRQQIYIL